MSTLKIKTLFEDKYIGYHTFGLNLNKIGVLTDELAIELEETDPQEPPKDPDVDVEGPSGDGK